MLREVSSGAEEETQEACRDLGPQVDDLAIFGAWRMNGDQTKSGLYFILD